MNTSPFDLTGKVALVTGASKGIGEAMARVFARFGAKVVVSSRKQAALDALAKDIGQTGGEACGIEANMGDMAQIRNLLTKTVSTYGKIDIVINNAATNPVYGPVQDCDGVAFDKIIEVNVKAPFELSKLAYATMKTQGGGSIINISSIGGVLPEPGLGIYSVSKAALLMLTKVMAKEWGSDNVRVNAICPGLIKTKFSRALWEDEKTLQRFTKHLPLGRIGNPEDIAGLALFLASDASAYCTGSVFMADGGATI